MKNLLYIIGLVAIAAVAIAVMKTNKTDVNVPITGIKSDMVEEVVTDEMPVVETGEVVVEEVTDTTTEAPAPEVTSVTE